MPNSRRPRQPFSSITAATTIVAGGRNMLSPQKSRRGDNRATTSMGTIVKKSTKEEWEELVLGFYADTSGESTRNFCERKGIGRTAFNRHWQKKVD